MFNKAQKQDLELAKRIDKQVKELLVDIEQRINTLSSLPKPKARKRVAEQKANNNLTEYVTLAAVDEMLVSINSKIEDISSLPKKTKDFISKGELHSTLEKAKEEFESKLSLVQEKIAGIRLPDIEKPLADVEVKILLEVKKLIEEIPRYGGGGASAWGRIRGDITLQEDLQAALSSALGADTLQDVTDRGVTTDNQIIETVSKTLVYTSGNLTSTTGTDGVIKTMTYNGDGTLNQLITTLPDASVITKTMIYSGGNLTGVNVT